MLRWIRSLAARFRGWAESESPPEVSVDRADSLHVLLLSSPLGPPRVVVRAKAADGTVRAVSMSPIQAELLTRQLRAALLALSS